MKSHVRVSIALSAMTMAISANAFAGDPAPAKAPAAPAAKPAAPAPAAKPATPAPAAKPAIPPAKDAKPMGPPAPPAELAAMFKSMQGNWKCIGKAMTPGGEMPMTATFKSKMDLDKWWIMSSFAETGRKGGYKFSAYTGYDGKVWSRVMVDNMGGASRVETAGPKDNKLTWEGTNWSMMGTIKVRDHEEMVSPKEQKMWGEMSMDNGKTWTKGYESTCKK